MGWVHNTTITPDDEFILFKEIDRKFEQEQTNIHSEKVFPLVVLAP